MLSQKEVFVLIGSYYVALIGLELCVDQAGLKLTVIHLPLAPGWWD